MKTSDSYFDATPGKYGNRAFEGFFVVDKSMQLNSSCAASTFLLFTGASSGCPRQEPRVYLCAP